MARLILLASLAILLSLACGQSEEPTARPTRDLAERASPTPIPTDTPTATSTPRPPLQPRFTVLSIPTAVAATPTLTPTQPATVKATLAPLTTPAVVLAPTPVAKTQEEARNLVWVYLTQCITFEPSQLNAYKVKEDWFVKAAGKSTLQFGVWKVNVKSGDLEPYDILSQEWRPYIESECSAEQGVGLVPVTPTPTVVPSPTPTRTPRPTPTQTPIPTSTPIVPSTTDAVASLWSYLVKCFPDAELADLEAVLDPVLDQYVVKDTDEIQYGVWRINQSDGIIKPDNEWARRRDETVRSGTC